MTLRLLVAALLAWKGPTPTNSHGAIVFPPSRNAVDGLTDPWRAGVPFPVTFNSTSPSCTGGDAHGRGATCTERPTYNAPQWCPVADASKDDHTAPYDNHGLSGANGQACYWFSNGCSIGCEECDGVTRGPMPGFSMAECFYPYPNRTEDEQKSKPPPNTAGAIAPGFCASTRPGGDCDTGASGSFLTSKWPTQTLAACVAKARSCKNANYVSFSAEHSDCSWYKACDIDHLQTSTRGYQTEVLHPQPLPAPSPAPSPEGCKAGTCSGMAVDAPDECLGTCRRKMNQCNSSVFAERPAICDPELRTYNVNATCGGPNDWYQFAPVTARASCRCV